MKDNTSIKDLNVGLLHQALVTLSEAIPSKSTILLCNADGVLITHTDNGVAVDMARVAAQAATAIGVGKRISNSLHLGRESELTLQGKFGRLMMYRVTDDICIAVVVPTDSNAAIVNILTQRAIKQLLDEDVL